MKLGYLYGGKIKGSINLGTDPYTGLPSTFKSGGLDIDGDVDLYFVAGQRLNVEKEGGVNEDYFNKFKVTSTDALALVNKVMCGVMAEAAFTEGTIGGASSYLAAIQGWLQYGKLMDAGACAIGVFGLRAGTTIKVPAGIAILTGAFEVKDCIAVDGYNFDYILNLHSQVGVVNDTDAGVVGAKAGYIRIVIGDTGAIRYIRLYDSGV